MGVRNNFFAMRMAEHYDGLPREVTGARQGHLDNTLRMHSNFWLAVAWPGTGSSS